MKSIKLLFLAILTVSIRQVSGEETDKKCGRNQYKCGDLCTYDDWSCSCGNVTLSKGPSYCCTAPEDKCTYDKIWSSGIAKNPVCNKT